MQRIIRVTLFPATGEAIVIDAHDVLEAGTNSAIIAIKAKREGGGVRHYLNVPCVIEYNETALTAPGPLTVLPRPPGAA